MSLDADLFPTAAPRAELLRRRALRQAWFAILAGLLIPFIALWGARTGWQLRTTDRVHGLVLVAAGLAVFGVRMGLYLLA
jgi:hypothetical protein